MENNIELNDKLYKLINSMSNDEIKKLIKYIKDKYYLENVK